VRVVRESGPRRPTSATGTRRRYDDRDGGGASTQASRAPRTRRRHGLAGTTAAACGAPAPAGPRPRAATDPCPARA